MCVLSIKVPIRKKSGNLFNDPRIYIYIYIYRHRYIRGSLNKFPWGLPEVVGTVEQVHGSRRRLLRRGLEFHVCTINKSAVRQKSGNLFNDPRTTRCHNDVNPTVHIHMQTTQYKYNTGGLCYSGTNTFINFCHWFFDTRRETQFLLC